MQGGVIMNKYAQLKDLGFRLDHTASERGYISRKIDFKIVPYIGRFGIGVKLLCPRYDTTQYVYICYYIMDSGILIFKNKHTGLEEKTYYDSFKNRKNSYVITINGYTREYYKDEYSVVLGWWYDLCN